MLYYLAWRAGVEPHVTRVGVSSIRIPPQLADAVDEDHDSARLDWLAALPEVIVGIASQWELELGEPYMPGGQCAWVAPASTPRGEELVLKIGWRHPEAKHEADALRFWEGDGAVRCIRTRSLEHTAALLLERCVPGVPLKCSVPEPEQDVVIARLMRRLWAHRPDEEHPFGSLREMCDLWAEGFELDYKADRRGFDPGLARDGMAMLRELPRTADRSVLLCTDLHAGNILASQREPWLVIDPKPLIGDPAFDPRHNPPRPRPTSEPTRRGDDRHQRTRAADTSDGDAAATMTRCARRATAPGRPPSVWTRRARRGSSACAPPARTRPGHCRCLS